ncbi:uncharacterized protein BXZ73DRAFT_73918 [Epithele typhae]|uniref:uncharacterized protein n=1 Tax=Epithele typhae TaxID=378194 RepID=UPI0020082127|nr:uncharacterized protein BXZ73DRAFT_73918 [Epithele typhae]KAH9944394.1 hypothetical protein BXZ73DRAFT_73918 [Epithele typhae]
MPPSPEPKLNSDDSTSRLSDAALRKKKNADAQAAFRARRANYIATLEETVTNLEAVVLELQESVRKNQSALQEARQENSRLKSELQNKDKMLRMYEQTRKIDCDPQDEYPMPSYAPARTPPLTMPSMQPGATNGFSDDPMRYPSASHTSSSMNGSYHNPSGQDYSQRSPALGYRYEPYTPYPIDTSARDGGWVGHSATTVSDGSMDSSSATHSPTFVESPTLTASEIQYQSRYGVMEDQKVPITPLATSPYMFAPSRSLSPAASTPSSASSTSLAPNSYAFTFPEGSAIADRPEFYGRRPQNPPELTLHGGTADVTAILRMSGRGGTAPTSERPVQAPSPYTRGDNGSGERESDGESSSYTYSSHSRTRTRTTSSASAVSVAASRASRSPSPDLRRFAQAFGALRRTRGRSKKTSEGAAKAAVEALAARGIGVGGDRLGNPAKRPRLHDGDGDLRI